MKPIFALILILLFVQCSSKPKVEIPSSVSATYWMARQQGRWYIENLLVLTNLDSSGVNKLSADSLQSLDVKYHFNSNQYEKADKEVTIILPEFEARELVNNFRNLTISNEKTDTPQIRSSLQSQSCS